MTKPNYPQLWQVLPAAVLSFFLSLITPIQAQEYPDIKQQIDGAIEQLQDSNPDNDAPALQKLGEIGPDAKDTALEIIKFLDKKYEQGVRSEAAVALARINPAPDLVLDGLIGALSDSNENVRTFVAIALGKLGESALDEINKTISEGKPLARDAAWLALEKMAESTTKKLNDAEKISDEKNYQLHIETIVKISDIWQKNAAKFSAEQLEYPAKFLDSFIPDLVTARQGDNLTGITSALTSQESILKQHRKSIKNIVSPPSVQLPAWLVNAVIGLGIYSLFPLTWLLLLRLHPLALLVIMKNLKIGELPITLPGGVQINLSIHQLLLLDFFHYHYRVLDAWVNQYVTQARSGFEQEETVQQNQVFQADVQIEIAGEKSATLMVNQLKQTFANNYSRLLIWGEAGCGKTSWACEIARWGMAEDKNQRLSAHLMIPVLLEPQKLEGQDSLVQAIMGELQGDILSLDANDYISEELLLQLLRKKRILVIVDSLSEMSEEGRQKISPQSHNFPVNALIVTSRQEEDLGKVVKTKVKLSRENANDRGENLN